MDSEALRQVPSTRKDLLLEKIIEEPLNFTEQDFEQIVNPDTGLCFKDLREGLKRVYNMSESALVAQSDATTGFMGLYNRYFEKRRKRTYLSKINSGFAEKENSRIIVAEGDSWFQFLGKDIINGLASRENYGIYTISYAGDWFANILFEEKYIEELSIHQPFAFLISGGGNDLVGGNRLAVMTCREENTSKKLKRTDESELARAGCSFEDIQHILQGQKHILPEFYSFLTILKCQYYLMFSGLMKSANLRKMAIITQGYDYAIPYKGLRFDWCYPWQPIVNKILGSGRWLYQPLMIRGIGGSTIQRSILVAMIFEFNEMFIELVRRPEFPYLYHIDNRGNAEYTDWFDELHLKPEAFRRISDSYHTCLESHAQHLAGNDWMQKNVINVFQSKKRH